MKRWALILSLAACSQLVQAGTRSSANYTVTDVIDSAGATAASANYSHQGSALSVSGISASTDSRLRSGYVGQLYAPVGIAITASPNTMNEGATRQLSSWRRMDDDTLDPILASSVAWSIESGPIATISAAGLATSKLVYRNTAAVVRADLAGDFATFSLTVTNVALDDFGAYAGDGLDDDWQVVYFGIGNTNAGPAKDADGDGQTNQAEFFSGYSPADINSYLTTDTLGVAGGGFRFRLSRVQPGTHYIFERSVDLKTWHAIFDFIPTEVAEPYVKSLPTAGAQSFYRVRLEAP